MGEHVAVNPWLGTFGFRPPVKVLQIANPFILRTQMGTPSGSIANPLNLLGAYLRKPIQGKYHFLERIPRVIFDKA